MPIYDVIINQFRDLLMQISKDEAPDRYRDVELFLSLPANCVKKTNIAFRYPMNPESITLGFYSYSVTGVSVPLITPELIEKYKPEHFDVDPNIIQLIESGLKILTVEFEQSLAYIHPDCILLRVANGLSIHNPGLKKISGSFIITINRVETPDM